MAWRVQGLVVPQGNPKGIGGLGDLEGLVIIPRQKQAGSQILLDHLLYRDGHDPGRLQWLAPPARNHAEVALAVAEGKAAAGFAVETVARQFRLDFVPLFRERYDLAIWRRDYFEPPLQKLFGFCRTDAFRTRADESAAMMSEVSGGCTTPAPTGAAARRARGPATAPARTPVMRPRVNHLATGRRRLRPWSRRSWEFLPGGIGDGRAEVGGADRVAGGEALDRDLDAVDGLEPGGSKDRGRRAGGQKGALVQQRHPGRAGESVVGGVGREHDAVALGGERAHLAEHERLVAEVEARGRLVHDDQGRRLGERAGDQGELALAAADPRVVGIRQRRDPEHAQGGERRGVIGAAGASERAEMGGPAHQHHVLNAVGEMGGMRLRHVGDASCDLGAGEAGQRVPARASPRRPGPATDRAGS